MCHLNIINKFYSYNLLCDSISSQDIRANSLSVNYTYSVSNGYPYSCHGFFFFYQKNKLSWLKFALCCSGQRPQLLKSCIDIILFTEWCGKRPQLYEVYLTMCFYLSVTSNVVTGTWTTPPAGRAATTLVISLTLWTILYEFFITSYYIWLSTLATNNLMLPLNARDL